MSCAATDRTVGIKSATWDFRYFPQLDGFRGICILLVLFGHASLTTFGQLAGLGVLMFFVLSGFLITGLLCTEYQATGSISLEQFYLRRALRILPAFFALILVTALLIKIGYVTDVPWYTVAVACLYLANIFGRGDSLSHLWSLSMEEQFYAAWPLVLRSIGVRRALATAAGSVLLAIAARAVVIQLEVCDYFGPKIYLRPWFRYDALMIGCCIALFLYHHQPNVERVRRYARFIQPVILFAALVLWTQYAERIVSLRPFYLTMQMFLAAAILFQLVAVPGGSTAGWLSIAPLRFLGRISYSVYLWQQIFLITNKPDWGWIRQFPWNILAAVAAGIASHYVVERPFLALKARFSSGAKPAMRLVAQQLLHPTDAS